MKVALRPYNLQLEHAFTISRRSYYIQPTLIVVLTEGAISGFGEATSNPYYGITIKKITEDINKITPFITALTDENPETFWQKLYPHLKNNLFALCALDMAYNDLYARKKGLKLHQLWQLNPNSNPLTDFTIGIDSTDKMISKMKELPWPIYKIKLGTKDDIAIVTALRKHTNAIFRVDANCGWTVDETIKNAKKLKDLGVEFIEQPLKADNWDGHKKVYQNAVLPIVADESCIIESDVDKCFTHFHGINVKLVKCGGLTPAKRMLEKAQKLGMKTMVGCMTESTVGISAIAHLLPLLNYVDMDGALLLKNDIAKGVTIKNGMVLYADTLGTGVQLLA
ncbi:MAG: dipeptide epimerase [Flavobacteriaceae bacterium]|nr:dipeptide epimerase [Flavobacteriaceae bacterium]